MGAERPHVALFEWMTGGHFGLYVERFAQALSPVADVTVVAPEPVCVRASHLPVAFLPLESERPPVDEPPVRRANLRHAAQAEIELLERTMARLRPSHLVHLHSDRIMRWLVGRPSFSCRVSVCIFRPRSHYPRMYGTRLSPIEAAKGALLELLVRRWRRRRDANALMTLDEGAATAWSDGAGAPAHWLPEPPVGPQIDRADGEWDCCLYGALAARKGVDLLAGAVASSPGRQRVVLAGSAAEAFKSSLVAYATQMRAAGADVDVRAWRHCEAEGLGLLSASRCAVLPYHKHVGMSRILVEAAHVGTPVVVHDYGLVGFLTKRHSLGYAVDCTDATAFRRAIASAAESKGQPGQSEALSTFASRFQMGAFSTTVHRALGI
jgi:hypothetical protein